VTDDSDTRSVFTQVEREPTLPDKVTRLLLDRVMNGALPSGTKLPSERELADQLGVSRTVVREAVRMLQAKGVLDVRSGGGARVAELDASLVGEPMKLYIQASGALGGRGYDDLNEVRHTLEVRLAVLACAAATDDDLARLRSAHNAFVTGIGDVETASRFDVEFHRTIAEITHNRLYVVLLDALGDVLLDIRRSALRVPENVALAREQHEAILAAIVARDNDAAREAMHRHLEDSRSIQAALEQQ
jgi:GntR family transcriptional repressor for pyruvate dehydrogenase complex